MKCLYCQQLIVLKLTWRTLFLPERKPLCRTCEESLVIIKGSRCFICSRPSERNKCEDCLWWEQLSERDTIQFNYSVYHYNNFMKEIISKWKYRGDSSLGYIFRHVFAATFRKLRSSLPQDIVAVPIPLNEQRQLERGFNQAAMLAGFLPIQTMEILERSTSEKQSKKTRNERIQSVNPFIVEKAINKPVILVDDIYTTGTTLRHAGKVLLEQGCPFVCALTLIRG